MILPVVSASVGLVMVATALSGEAGDPPAPILGAVTAGEPVVPPNTEPVMSNSTHEAKSDPAPHAPEAPTPAPEAAPSGTSKFAAGIQMSRSTRPQPAIV